jgi:hypothetical protein
MRSVNAPPSGIPDDEFRAFSAALVQEGVAAEALTPEVSRYLRQRLVEELYQRLDRADLYLEVRSARDTPLATAVDFLHAATSQAELFTLAAEREAAAETQADAAPLR